MHINSIEAYYQEVSKLTGRRADVYRTVKARGTPVTDREVMALLGFRDMNAVRPRISELVKHGLLRECDSTPCPVTGKKVRRVAPLLVSEPEQFDLKLN